MANLCHTEYAAQKKALLENTLLKLMELREYQQITVTDICRESGIPRRTFYHYFEGKEGILESVIETLIRQCFMDASFDFRQGQEQIRKNFLRIFQYWEGENRRKLDVLIRNGLELRLMAWSSQWVREDRMVAFLERNLDPDFVEIILMIGATDFFALLFHWSRGGYRETPEKMADYAVSVLPQALLCL